ncbi:MAG: MFS transporter [Pseudobdellovibrionaceae bacterium]
MLINLSPLKKYPDYRKLFIGQMISFLGTMVSYVAIPYQVYEMTQSSLYVGLLGTVQLVPVLLFGLLGGAVADSMDRKKLILISEGVMCVACLALMFNASVAVPSLWVIFAATALLQAANGFHRPAMEAMTQKLIKPEDFASIGALNSFRYTFAAVAGPALGGLLIANFGAKTAYIFDLATFAIAMVSIWMIRQTPAPESSKRAGLDSIMEGLKYAWRRPDLMGTYIVDIVAMTFAFPTVLFPAMGAAWGGAGAAGALYSAMAVGSMLMTLFSGWTTKVFRHGRAVVLSAAAWGIAIIFLGYAPNLWTALLCLGIAGAADMISALFRGVIWNESIPNEMRGRLAGIEMISYMTGPLLGNARAGWMAAATSNQVSIVSGGILCVIGVLICGFALPKFWKYTSLKTEATA